jgi:hypothetical protein
MSECWVDFVGLLSLLLNVASDSSPPPDHWEEDFPPGEVALAFYRDVLC